MSFKSELKNWLIKNGFDVNINYAKDFSYAMDTLTINFGTESYPEVGRYFEQFLYEFGLEYTGIFDNVLAFLHELGHHLTIDCFEDGERLIYHLTKQFIDVDDEHEWYNYYWMVPDEFAANVWEINFINSHIEAVEELCNIVIKEYYNAE